MQELLNNIGLGIGIVAGAMIGIGIVVILAWCAYKFFNTPRVYVEKPAGTTPPAVITTTTPAPIAKPAAVSIAIDSASWTIAWKIVLSVLLIAAVWLVLYWLIHNFSPPTLPLMPAMPLLVLPSLDEPYMDKITWILVAAMLIALVIAFIVGDRTKLLTYAFVTVLLIFVLAQYQTGGIYLGYRRDVLYLLAIAALILVATYATQGKERITFALLVVAIFILLGFSHLFDWERFKSEIASISWPTSSSTNPCDTVIRHARVGQNGSELNPGGRCSFTFQVTEGQLYFSGPQGRSEVWWPDKTAIGQVRKRMVQAIAVTPAAELDYMLCPPGKDGSGWYCH